MDKCITAQAMSETFYIKDLHIYSFRVKLIPFGWEYWDANVVSFAGCLFSVIKRTKPGEGSADKLFLDWLEAHISAWENFWSASNGWSGPLKRMPPTP